MALAHHDAAHSDKRCGGKAPFLRAKQTGNSNVTSSANLTISLDNDTIAKIIEHERLMGLRETKLPRQTRVFDASPLRRTGAAVMTGNSYMICLGLGHPTSDDSDTDFRNKLDGNARARVRALEIVDQLF